MTRDPKTTPAMFKYKKIRRIGGHLLSARINGACELLIGSFGDTKVGRKYDDETGLNLYEF